MSRKSREPPARSASRTGSPRPIDAESPDARRHAWLVQCLESHVRTGLQSVLLWVESLEASGAFGAGPDRSPEERDRALDQCARKMRRVEGEVRDLIALVDDVVSVGRPEDDEGPDGWPRSVVVRDLLAAVLRAVEPERSRRGVALECRSEPEDLRMVADPDHTLQAVVGLVRAGMRAARTGQRVRLVASQRSCVASPGGRGGEPSVRIELRAPRLSLGAGDDVDALAAGIPSPDVDPGSRASAFPLTVAGRYAGLLDGSLTVERPDGPDGPVVLSLCLPRDRAPERRPGWTP